MSFDPLAPHYRWLETVLAGSKLQRCRTAFLDHLPPLESILLLGEGHGRFLAPCRKRFPLARITCVDASAGMLRQARRNLRRQGLTEARLAFVHADALVWPFPAAHFDLIVTHFFLDCFPAGQLAQLVARLSASARAEAHWLLADFQAGGGPLARLRNRLILSSMYGCFRVATHLPARELTAPDPFLAGAGFTLQQRRKTEWGLLHSDWWQRPARRLEAGQPAGWG